MGVLSAMLVLFVWMRLGGAIDLSWWWILLPVGVTIADGFLTGMYKEFRAQRRARLPLWLR